MAGRAGIVLLCFTIGRCVILGRCVLLSGSFCNMVMKIDHYSPWFTSLTVNYVIHHQKAISFHHFISAGDYDKRLHALVRWIQRGRVPVTEGIHEKELQVNFLGHNYKSRL